MHNIITYGPTSGSFRCVNITHQPRRLIITIDKSYCFLCWKGVEANLSSLDENLTADLPDINLERIFRTSVNQEKVNSTGSALICETCRLYFRFATHFKILCETACTLKKGVKANEDLVRTLRDGMHRTLDTICDKRKHVQESENNLLVVLKGQGCNREDPPIVHLVNHTKLSYDHSGGLPSIIRVPKTLKLTKANVDFNTSSHTNGSHNTINGLNDHNDGEIMSDMLSQSAFEDFLSSTSTGDTDQTMQDVEKALTEICKNLQPRNLHDGQQYLVALESKETDNNVEHRLDDMDNQLLEGYLNAFPLEDESMIEKNLEGIVDHVVGSEIVEAPSDALYVNAVTGELEVFSPSEDDDLSVILQNVPWPVTDEVNDSIYKSEVNEIEQFKISFKCYFCQRCFVSDDELSAHWCTKMKKEKATICPFCGLIKSIYSVHPLFCRLKLEQPDPVQCPYDNCDLNFKHKKSLYNHILRIHNRTGPFECDRCGKKFTTKMKVQHHLQFVHLNQRNFQCQLCSKKFHTQWHLE